MGKEGSENVICKQPGKHREPSLLYTSSDEAVGKNGDCIETAAVDNFS